MAEEEKASEVRDEDPMVESLDEKHWRLYLYVRVVLGPPSLVKKKNLYIQKKFYINNYFKLICSVTILILKSCIYIF